MQPDSQRIQDTIAWLRRVVHDLRGAEIDLAASPPLLDDVAFHSQQAAEKAIKAFLTWHDRPFRRVHDLAELGRQCAALDPSLESVCRRAERLSAYAWSFRYPGGAEEPSAEEAEEALSLAHELVGAILARLPDDVRP